MKDKFYDGVEYQNKKQYALKCYETQTKLFEEFEKLYYENKDKKDNELTPEEKRKKYLSLQEINEKNKESTEDILKELKQRQIQRIQKIYQDKKSRYEKNKRNNNKKREYMSEESYLQDIQEQYRTFVAYKKKEITDLIGARYDPQEVYVANEFIPQKKNSLGNYNQNNESDDENNDQNGNEEDEKLQQYDDENIQDEDNENFPEQKKGQKFNNDKNYGYMILSKSKSGAYSLNFTKGTIRFEKFQRQEEQARGNIRTQKQIFENMQRKFKHKKQKEITEDDENFDDKGSDNEMNGQEPDLKKKTKLN
ncbi:hypothetical protein PPERSA_02312 [Pseudocohnilembus persalinus]|uniref:Uncharacterized protein n=1 Tax=Pseudocohnilembus persalinus TaxID=266149 RepID=A0A0V0QU51_PSEPJ|nr:hypothetical protein PPERSA_02312 [Pseudocohnilembus persalinus]|eukprot:KRX05780.1 hypothetical protein PPERSA_02312 [Pseudocohnilembus persalinus]